MQPRRVCKCSDKSWPRPILPLVAPALLSLLCSLCSIQATPEADDGERFFNLVNSSQIKCRNVSYSQHLAERCQDADCFIAAAGGEPDGTKLRHQEWASVSQAMQDLAREDRLNDQYPEGMHVALPMSGLRQRLCPVKYEVQVYTETVPMLIVHARCTKSMVKSPARESNGYLYCHEVLQYRQVYRKLPECKTSDTGAFVYEKHFVNVSVNCAANYD